MEKLIKTSKRITLHAAAFGDPVWVAIKLTQVNRKIHFVLFVFSKVFPETQKRAAKKELSRSWVFIYKTVPCFRAISIVTDNICRSWEWQPKPVILALRRWIQEDWEFKVSIAYIASLKPGCAICDHCLQKAKLKTTNTQTKRQYIVLNHFPWEKELYFFANCIIQGFIVIYSKHTTNCINKSSM